jgi:type II secretory pathway pseudopilin PulG
MKHFRTKSAFTLIETLVAVVIFTTSLATLLLVAGRGVAGSTSAREDLTARLLAMEGTELARNQRDSNVLSGQNWDDFLLSTCSNGCDIDYSTPQPMFDASIGGQPLWVNQQATYPVAYAVDQTFTEQSLYSREITITQGVSPDELRVLSRVTWNSRGRTRSVEYVTYLNRWYQPAPPVVTPP